MIGHTQSVTSLAVTSNRLASGSDDTTIRIWNTVNYNLLYNLTGHTVGISSLAMFSNNYVASGSWDTSVKVWDAN